MYLEGERHFYARYATKRILEQSKSLQDPTGVNFSLWQAKKNVGTGITGLDGTLCWADLNTPDQTRAGQF
jgi:hypothetical protein